MGIIVESLQNHLLVAMPTLEDPFFGRTVTYLCEHNAEGAMGIVLNHPLQLTVSELLKQMDIPHNASHPQASWHVCAGGPVQSERGFVLHSPREGYHSSLRLNDDLMITTSKDILEDLASDFAPDKFLLALGYAGWTAGQLEEELSANSWLVLPYDPHVIFDLPHHEKWQGAAQAQGISVWQLSATAGHA